MTTSVMWFRRDLRLADNPALLTAMEHADEVLPLFVLDDALWKPAGAARRAFLVGCLRALDRSMDGALVVRRGAPAQVVVDVAREAGTRVVTVAEDFGPYGRRRDEKVAAALQEAGVEFLSVDSAYAVAPGSLSTGQGTPYRVFSPFSRAWRAHGWSRPTEQPSQMTWRAGVLGDELPGAPSVTATLPEPGEEAALHVTRSFWNDGLADYRLQRDLPGADRTSRLSPYLKWGCIHPRQLLAKLGTSASERRFRDELCWREFYADVLFNNPASAHRSLRPTMRGLHTDRGARADTRFEAWATGRTGFPLVDAGMRQLLAEAWMHNRVRMLVASFLVKDLHLDWTRGARWFLDHLVDGDLASNNHGWQWAAGTGTDPSPFVRVFNPVTQSKRFDPDGVYVRRYVPELRGVPAPEIHEPWKLPGGPPNGYPPPIVDHAAERIEALARFGELSGG